DEVRPDVVLTFGPDGQTFHPDHIAVSRWTTHAVRMADADPDLLYAVMTPEWVEAFAELVPMDQVMMTDDPPPSVPASELALWFWCDDVLAARKVAALRCQASQVEPLVAMGGLDAYTLLTRDEFYRRATASDWSG
ncbi:MAG: hypothetical protein KDB36_06090, partial [Acidimicrobiales bacterium]|nr:hypothetical protein [Acidimicrobiales bacterium]